ncbi:MAG: hypothetical protein GY755_06800, partial [Chloroflexi bacterium]|nr:hypothetical protein [Chloroflexota bacterium]
IKDYPTALAQLYKQIKIKHQSKWENRKNQQTLVFKNNKKWNHKLTKLFGKLFRNDSSIMIKVLSEHIEINKYYHDKNYKIQSVIRDKEIMDHYNSMSLAPEKRAQLLQHIDSKTNQLKSDLYILNNRNNPNIPPLLSQNNQTQNYNHNHNHNHNHNKSDNTNLITIYPDDPQFESLYNNHEFDIPLNINNYINNHNDMDAIQDEKCTNCKGNHTENLSHYICQCTQFENERKILKQKLSKIDNRLQNNWFNISTLLFPYKNKTLKKSFTKQISIWKYLIQFIKHTKRIRTNFTKSIDETDKHWQDLLKYEKEKEEKMKLLYKLKQKKKQILKNRYIIHQPNTLTNPQTILHQQPTIPNITAFNHNIIKKQNMCRKRPRKPRPSQSSINNQSQQNKRRLLNNKTFQLIANNNNHNTNNI